MQNLYSINPLRRHNLPPHLEITTFNFPKVFQNFKNLKKITQIRGAAAFTIYYQIQFVPEKPGVYNFKRNLARSCFPLIYNHNICLSHIFGTVFWKYILLWVLLFGATHTTLCIRLYSISLVLYLVRLCIYDHLLQ